MNRPKTSGKDLPPRMIRRVRILVSGKRWVGYYYAGRDDSGRRKEIPLGTDLNEAKRKWAELECQPAPVETGLMRHIFDRYIREVIPGKERSTQKDNLDSIRQLRSVFDSAPIDVITPQHIAQYRDKRTAMVRANREISLFSNIWNLAREWGYTAKENPCKGVRKNRETPRQYYADRSVWEAVYAQACIELQDAMDVAYLTGQRPCDVLRMMITDIRDDAIEVNPSKTRGSSGKRLRILLVNPDSGQPTELGMLIDRIKSRPRKVQSLYLLATPAGVRLNRWTLRVRFDAARAAAAKMAEESGLPESATLAARIRGFQFRDIRPKAASEMELEHARKLLGHTNQQITATVYRRVGETVKPTK